MSSHALIFATGPHTTPPDPSHARMLGWEERVLDRRCDEEPGRFRLYVHTASVPELVAYARALGRDCTYVVTGPQQATLLVAAERQRPDRDG